MVSRYKVYAKTHRFTVAEHNIYIWQNREENSRMIADDHTEVKQNIRLSIVFLEMVKI